MQDSPILAAASRFAWIPVVVATLLLATYARAAGVLALKEQPFHSDKSAKPVPFSTLADSSGPLVNIVTGKSSINIERSKIAGVVYLPDVLPLHVTRREDIEAFRQAVENVRDFTRKYPKSGPMLQARLAGYDRIVNRFDSGEVRYNGEWMTGEEFAVLRAKVTEARKNSLASVEKQDAEVKARVRGGKGLEEYKGEWLPAEEVRKRVQEDRWNEMVLKEVESKMIPDASYSAFKITDRGLLIEIHEGKPARGSRGKSIAFLADADATRVSEGERYRTDLYWCGTYTHMNPLGDVHEINSYCVTKSYAAELVDAKMAMEARIAEERRKRSGQGIDKAVYDARSSGSGFFIGNDGYLITNHHVVFGTKSLSIWHAGKEHAAKVVLVDRAADLALLKVEVKQEGIPISRNEAGIGTDVFAIGYPHPDIQGTDVKLTKGIISSSSGLHRDAWQFQIDAAVQPGNSGGPLCNAAGEVVGVVVARLDAFYVVKETGSLPENVNYAIKAAKVLEMLAKVGIRTGDKWPGERADPINKAAEATVLILGH